MRPITFAHKKVGGGVVTLCRLDDGHPEHVTIGAAWCSPDDHWNRKLGNAIAEGRARCARRPDHQVVIPREHGDTPWWHIAWSQLSVWGFLPRWVGLHDRPTDMGAA